MSHERPFNRIHARGGSPRAANESAVITIRTARPAASRPSAHRIGHRAARKADRRLVVPGKPDGAARTPPGRGARALGALDAGGERCRPHPFDLDRLDRLRSVGYRRGRGPRPPSPRLARGALDRTAAELAGEGALPGTEGVETRPHHRQTGRAVVRALSRRASGVATGRGARRARARPVARRDGHRPRPTSPRAAARARPAGRPRAARWHRHRPA